MPTLLFTNLRNFTLFTRQPSLILLRPLAMQPMLIQTEYLDSPMTAGRVFDWAIQPKGEQPIALFFVHGGGWQGGSKVHFHRLMEWFGQRGYWTASTDYRLGQSVRLRDQISDIRQSYHLFRQKLAQAGGPKSVLVIGSSAGAHLSLMLSLAQPGECGETVSDEIISAWKPPVGVIVQSAPTRFEEWPEIFPGILGNMQQIMGCPYKGNEEEWQRFAPIKYLREDSMPLLFLEAANEHMFPHEYVLEFIEKSNSIGVEASHHMYAHAEHGFLYDHTRPVQQRALADCLRFIEKLSSKDS